MWQSNNKIKWYWETAVDHITRHQASSVKRLITVLLRLTPYLIYTASCRVKFPLPTFLGIIGFSPFDPPCSLENSSLLVVPLIQIGSLSVPYHLHTNLQLPSLLRNQVKLCGSSHHLSALDHPFFYVTRKSYHFDIFFNETYRRISSGVLFWFVCVAVPFFGAKKKGAVNEKT